MRSRTLALLAGCGVAIAVGAADAQRFRSAAELVTVDVLVTDGRTPVSGLKPADFELLDNGTVQQIDQLYVEQLPVNVVMVLDTSGSVRGERLQSLKAGAMTVIDRLRKIDRAALVSFSHRIDLNAALTADIPALRRSVTSLEARGSTALRDASFAALALRGAESTRTLILLFSDGLDTSSVLGEQQVLEVARRSDAIVYAIGIRETPAPRSPNTPGAPFALRQPAASGVPVDDRFLNRLSHETAGRLLYAERNRDIERTFARVLDEFNSRYVLGYTPRDVARGGWHQLEVRLKKRGTTVLARRGYLAN